MKRINPATIKPRPATPPITPPTILPVDVLELPSAAKFGASVGITVIVGITVVIVEVIPLITATVCVGILVDIVVLVVWYSRELCDVVESGVCVIVEES